MRGRRGFLLGLLRLVGIGLLGGLIVFSLPGRRDPVVPERGLRVVTTTPVLFSLAAKILGEFGTIINLVPPGASPENYALRPQDAEAAARADVLVMNGLGFERFLEGVVADARGQGIRVVVASDGVETTPFSLMLSLDFVPDPHVWVDPLRAIRMVENIAGGLAAADPPHVSEYRANAEAAAAQLRALDQEFREALADVARRDFIAFHPAWGYFAERYGLRQVAVIEETPGKEPTAQELARLMAHVRETGVKDLFGEPQFSPRIVEALARDLDLSAHTVNPEGGDLSPSGYDTFMRANVATFVRALSVP